MTEDEKRVQQKLRSWAETGIEPDFSFQPPVIDEADRQMIILALARLSLDRPGWEIAVREVCKKFQGEALLDEFLKTHMPH